MYIGSKTPAEIALSIMAEIVALKNGICKPSLTSVITGKLRDEEIEHHATDNPSY
ncbi:hypothetical protein [Undibacterium sp. RuTC16W]|uniref:hypothetical protein n=1 Tax=Undibacterium sp. RuTC16W TaxID=3413048 RepID=UPI003BF286F8